MTPERLSAGDVSLRPWQPDEGQLYADLRDDLVFRFTTEDADLDGDSCGSNIADARHSPHRAAFAICDPGGTPVGHLAVNSRNGTAELSYWLSSPARGKGWAASALRAATDWAFDELDAERAELEIDPANTASVRVAEAAGYHRHGTRLQSACGGPALLYHRSREP